MNYNYERQRNSDTSVMTGRDSGSQRGMESPWNWNMCSEEIRVNKLHWTLLCPISDGVTLIFYFFALFKRASC